ncbi:uncharacterized protein LOC111692546 [Anoplophora glabripennis]|uniref:uncharacterized protein LOC111692546 n=1 Tax=Anoplophora glabripennis TaxID=217634 RepID=UPI000C77ECDE|nr:uncharacterized protein LOC111692546 [Anoplophora glabripennis]
MRDDHEFNIKFVSVVEAFPCLYDNTREDYHMSHVQERAWAKIAKNIGEGATIADCKKRNLRGSYTKHLKTYMPSGSGASAKRSYYLSEYISFVLPFTKSRQPKGNVEASKNNQETEELEPEQLGSPNEVGNYKNNHGKKHDSDDEQSITEDVNQDVSDVILSQRDSLEKNDSLNPKQGKQKKSLSSSSVLSENTRKPKRSKTTQNEETLEVVNKSAFEYFEKKKQAPYKPPALTNDDADMQFLLSLLSDLKKITDKQKRKFKASETSILPMKSWTSQ